MGESQLSKTRPEVYERLIDRVGLALETARTAVKLRDELPVELELRGLSPAEFAVIKAWLATQAPGRLAQAGIDPQPRAPARIIWLKDRKQSATAAHSHKQPSR
ncbi:hypothetical protein SJI00_17210 [Pseudomonas sp. RP23018S]|uniref:hypothetical protein n=1 Tax=Pseudomonas sp. RP23018S TaxID=3096037 RepID=UPI002ACA40A1|nr:hypothetical protein [Pseudomonas sp. RP23018S]MDZ5604512.1 hypothetical protein [Pseudomonas sp. RP23018S]